VKQQQLTPRRLYAAVFVTTDDRPPRLIVQTIRRTKADARAALELLGWGPVPRDYVRIVRISAWVDAK
jgi:hypothetical protein